MYVSIYLFKDDFLVYDLILHLLFISIRPAWPFLAHFPLPAPGASCSGSSLCVGGANLHSSACKLGAHGSV